MFFVYFFLITDHLEDFRAASILTSIDYSKAFNRIKHLPLLESFAAKGAPNFVIRLLAAFLSGRQMTVKLGTSRSKPRPVNAGAPQGSVLGTYVFNVATDDLEGGVVDEDTINENEEENLSYLETQADETIAHSTPDKNAPGVSLIESPIASHSDSFVILPNTKNVPHKLKKRIEPTWRNKPLSVRKFVDDNLQIDKVNMAIQRTFRQGNVVFKNPRVVNSERMFRHIACNAKKKGLIVNAAKTSLLTISASKSYEAMSHFYDNDRNVVESTDELKALGFVFNKKGDASTQIDRLCTKFRQKVWSLRHLRKLSFTEEELVCVYTSYLRPGLEYSAPIYHSMLTQEQDYQIEKQQYFALKNIFGFEYSHRQLLELSGLSTLRERRENATLKGREAFFNFDLSGR